MANGPDRFALGTRIHRAHQDYPEHGPGTFRYPPPRKRTGGPLTAADAAAGVLDGPGGEVGNLTVAIWPFRLKTTAANTRSIVVSPPFQGPAILDELLLVYNLKSTVMGGISLFYAEDGNGQGIALTPTTRPTGTEVFSQVSIADTPALDADEVLAHFPVQNNNTLAGRPVSFRLGYLITLGSRFWVKASGRSGNTEHVELNGMLRIVQGVDLPTLRRHL